MAVTESWLEPAARAAMYVRFWKSPRPEGRKTDSWTITTSSSDGALDIERLGLISWYGRWRAYAFFPLGDTVFEKVCLRDIADFCERQTKLHRESKRAQKSQPKGT